VQGGLAATGFNLLQSGRSKNPVASASGGGLVLSAGAELWRGMDDRLVLDLRAKLAFMSVSDTSLANLSGDKIGARQTTIMATLSWY
jgi:hypothetical protein